jgi:tRNA pseudouridine38-40 synthase
VIEQETRRLRLDIAYDGTDFLGWAKQPGLRTVQGVLEDALAILFAKHDKKPVLSVAGRTDAGVHAIGQVAHVDLTDAQLASLDVARGTHPRRHDGPAALARRLNGIAGLQSDVHVTRSDFAPPGFDARFSAVWRRYEYRIADSVAPRNPLLRNHTVWFPAELDVDAMNAAAWSLLGLHDWVSYCKPREGATTIRTLQDFTWERVEGGILVARLRADAFCHSMVRALVGATVAVGQGKLAVSDAVAIRDAAERTSAYKVMPAKGLSLLEVGYPDAEGMAARAELTRQRRDARLTEQGRID